MAALYKALPVLPVRLVPKALSAPPELLVQPAPLDQPDPPAQPVRPDRKAQPVSMAPKAQPDQLARLALKAQPVQTC